MSFALSLALREMSTVSPMRRTLSGKDRCLGAQWGRHGRLALPKPEQQQHHQSAEDSDHHGTK